MVRLGEMTPIVWDKVIEFMEWKLVDFDFQEDDILFDWRVTANMLKLERELYELYGPFKDIILHPIVQYLLELWNRYVDLNVTLGDPLLPLTTAVVILFMMHKRVDNFILALTAALMFNINPIYVIVAAIIWKFSIGSKGPKGYKKTLKVIVSVEDLNAKHFTTASPPGDFDYVILGGDVGSFFSAALLAKVGFRCCVLCPVGAPPMELQPPGWAAPVPVKGGIVAHVERYQLLLDAVQALDLTKRVTFKPLGSLEDTYAHTVVSLFPRGDPKKASTCVLFTGENSLATALANKHAVDKVEMISLFQKISACFLSMTSYVANKVTPGDKSSVAKDFTELVAHSVKSVTHQLCQDNDMFETLAAAAIVGAEEALPASLLSAIGLAAVINLSEEGAFVPVGGVSAVIRAMSETILSAGGVVFKDVTPTAIAVSTEGNSCKAIGVELDGGALISASKGVLTGLGVLNTYTRMLPSKLVSHKTRSDLAGCVESRPKVFVFFEVNGSKETLGLRDCDYIESEKQSIASVDDPVAYARLAESYLKIWSPTVRDAKLAEQYGDKNVVVVEMYASDADIGRAAVHFTDAPLVGATALAATPEFGTAAAATVTYNYDSRSAQVISTVAGISVPLAEAARNKVLARATSRLVAVYPKCNGCVVRTYVAPPTIGGHTMSADGISGDLAGPGLQGEFQAGYLGASAALNYTVSDFLLNRNIIRDLHNVPQ